MRVFPNLVDSVFELLDNEFKKSASETKASNSIEEKNLQNRTDVEKMKEEKSENGLSDGGASKQEETAPKKTKKRKPETCDENSAQNDCQNVKKKKKTKIEEQTCDVNGQDVTINGEQESQKKKKKKRKLETLDEPEAVSCDGQIVEDKLVQENGVDELESRRKKKKKQKIAETDDKSDAPCDTEKSDMLTNGNEAVLSKKDAEQNGDEETKNVNGDAVSKKKKKKKKEKGDSVEGAESAFDKSETTGTVAGGKNRTEKKENSREPEDEAQVKIDSGTNDNYIK
jgi:hypothetical protein